MKRGKSVTAFSAGFAATLCFSVQVAYAQMKAHFIDVGQAESNLREFRCSAVLIDAGDEEIGGTREGDHMFDYIGSERITPYRINKFGSFLSIWRCLP